PTGAATPDRPLSAIRLTSQPAPGLPMVPVPATAAPFISQNCSAPAASRKSTSAFPLPSKSPIPWYTQSADRARRLVVVRVKTGVFLDVTGKTIGIKHAMTGYHRFRMQPLDFIERAKPLVP